MSSDSLENLCSHSIGGGWGQEVSDDKHTELVAIIRGTDIPRVASGDVSTVPHRWETTSKIKNRLCQPGDILVEVSGGSAASGQHTGRALFITEKTLELLGGRVIPASFCRLLRLDRARVDSKYVAYQVASMHLSGEIVEFENQSTGIANFQFTRFLSSVYPIVGGKEEQLSISAFLSNLDDRISLLRETNATLEAIAQALFKSWFVDFDPVRAKMEGRSPEGMDEATAALFPDSFEESELGLVPRGWRNVSLREAVSIHDSKRIPLSGQEREERKGPYPYYGAAALMGAVDDYLFDGVYLLTGEDGSVADLNGYPIMQYVWGKFWVNNHAHILQGKDGVATEHVMLAMKRTNIAPYITGAVQAKLSQTNMWRINFLMPTREVAEHFGSVLAPLFVRFRHNQDQAQTLATLRDTLLPRLISGQLRLPEAQEELEAA